MIEIKNLCKTFGRHKALDNVNLTINSGELFGFVGANGAGKTTTMKICVGLLGADKGEVYIDGIPALTDNRTLKSKVGYVPDFFGVYDNLTAIEYLEFFAATYGIWGDEATALCMDLLELVNLSDKKYCEVDGLSRGMKQRLCLARALVHNPDILFLDEPASGLDPKARFELKEILKNLCSMGKTIVISSHILPELAEMCTSIGIIEKGKIVINGPIDDVLSAASGNTPIIVNVADNAEKAIKVLKEFPEVTDVKSVTDRLEISCKMGNETDIKLLKALVNAGIPVISYGRREGSLESLFIDIVNNNGLLATDNQVGGEVK